jgi:hypothetical protein
MSRSLACSLVLTIVANLHAATTCTPSKVGELFLSNGPAEIAITGSTVYTVGLARLSGVDVNILAIDISNRAAPVISGFNILAGEDPAAIEVAGNYAYVTSNRGLHILDITNRNSLVHKIQVTLPGIFPTRLRIANNRAYVIGGGSGFSPSRLYIVDVSNPVSPVVLGNYEQTATFYDVEVSGTTVYVATHQSAGNIVIVDASNPAAPVATGTLSEPGVNNVFNLALRDNVLLGINDNGITVNDELLVMDVTNRARPRVVKKLDLHGHFAQDVAIVGSRGIALDADRNTLMFFDISNLDQTTEIGTLALTDRPFRFAADGVTAAVLLFFGKSVGLVDYATCLPITPRKRAIRH